MPAGQALSPTDTAIPPTITPTLELALSPAPKPTDTAEPTEIPSSTPPHPWTRLARMPTPRSEMSAVFLNGRIYVPGGFGNNFRPGIERVFEAYDALTDTWIRLADIPSERANHHATAVFGEHIYIFSDWGGGSTLRYDPAADSWTERTPPPEPRYAGAAVTWGAYIYLVGGVGSGSTNAVLRYDPGADTWDILAAHEQRREHVAAAVLEGEIHLLGGRLARDFNLVEVYNIAEDRWRVGSSMLEARAGLGAVTIGSRIYAAGGELLSVYRTLKTVEYYDAGAEKWQPAGFTLPYPLHGLPLVTDGMQLYAVGGSDALGTASNRGELFVLEP